MLSVCIDSVAIFIVHKNIIKVHCFSLYGLTLLISLVLMCYIQQDGLEWMISLCDF